MANEDSHHVEDRIASLFRRALLLKEAGQLEESIQVGLLAMEQTRQALDVHSHFSRSMINLIAGTYFDQRNLLVSRALFEWLSRTAREAGSDQRTTAIVDSNRGHCLLHEGHYDEAVPLLKDAFDRLVPLDPAAALQSLHGVAWSAFHLGLYDLAADFHRTVLDARLRLLPPEDIEIANSFFNLATALDKAGRPEEAAFVCARRARLEGQAGRRPYPRHHGSLRTSEPAPAAGQIR
ncbi:MAG TPA: tetratricopeptide repeat protein [Candidatus Sulfotelmatobacter sp.]